MVEYSAPELDHTYAALADPTRRAILGRLRGGPARVTDLAAPFAATMSLAAVSKHVRVLEAAGLVRRTVAGREHHITLEPAPLREATRWMDTYRAFWEARLDALDRYLRATGPKDAPA